MSRITGKSVLITGGAMGLGRLMAERSVELGAKRVILWDINATLLESTAQALRSAGESAIETHVVDVSAPEAIAQAAESVLANGAVDILFNNAGIVVGKPYWENTADDIEKTIRINVLGVMHVARAFLPAMRDQNSGSIVNIASAAGLVAVPRGAVYSGSKHAVLGWSESVRIELEQENSAVLITTVCPSYINTGMFDGVKAPLLTPILQPSDAVDRIMRALEKGAPVVRMPWIVNLLPLMKGTLTVRLFDFIAGKIFRVYDSMGQWKGHGK